MLRWHIDRLRWKIYIVFDVSVLKLAGSANDFVFTVNFLKDESLSYSDPSDYR